VTKKIRNPTTDLGSPLAKHLGKLPGFLEILARVDSYTELGSRLNESLPVSLRAHVRFASIDGQNLRFLADSSAWATKLRLLSDTVVASAHSLGYSGVTALAIRVRRVGDYP
jgi:hypothetical protein